MDAPPLPEGWFGKQWACAQGAAAASGAYLCFTDADGQIHPETFNVVKRTMDTGKCVAGATGVTLAWRGSGVDETGTVLFQPADRYDERLAVCP